MAPARRSNLALLLSVAAAMAAAQQSGSTTASQGSGVTNTVSAATTTDVPMELWSIANGLLSSYYPSTTISAVSTLTWPDSVVIDGTTYNAQSLSDATATSSPPSTHNAATTPTAAPTDSAAKGNDTNPHKTGGITDKKLGIIIGCVIGLVVLILLCVVFWCMKRRKDDTGSFFMRRRTPSIASSGIRSWLPSAQDNYGNTTYVSAGGANADPWEKPHSQVNVRPAMAEPRMSQHPAFAPARLPGSSRSTSEEISFYMDRQMGYTPERDLEREPYDPLPVELDDEGRVQRQSAESLRATGDRPPTPFSPMEMMGFGNASRAVPPTQTAPARRDFGHDPAPQQSRPLHNPFSSPEDEETDLVSPILPSKSPERRHSPMVHYPSWSEVSEFDFHGDGRRSGLRNMSSGETTTDGGDGWRPLRERESAEGRYELA